MMADDPTDDRSNVILHRRAHWILYALLVYLSKTFLQNALILVSFSIYSIRQGEVNRSYVSSVSKSIKTEMNVSFFSLVDHCTCIP